MKRKQWAVLLALVLAVVMIVSGCAKKQTPSETPAASESEKESSVEEAPVEEEAPAEEESPAEEAPTEEAAEEVLPSEEEIAANLASTIGQLGELTEEGSTPVNADAQVISGINMMRRGFIPEIKVVEPEELTADEENQMDRAMRAYTPGDETPIVNNSTYYYFYDQLTPEMQSIYDAIYLVAMDPTTKDNIITLYTDKNPKSNEFAMEYYSALLAIGYDHPELWWIYPWNGTYSVDAFVGQPANGHNTVYLQMNQTYDNFEKDVDAFNTAVDQFLADIDTTKSDAEIALQVHDKLIKMAIYDNEVLNKNLNDFAHTAFGPLVSNSRGDANYCVCDGYSMAYEYLLGQLGIPATVVTGMAGDAAADGGMGGHAWSIVQIDGKWFEIDTTWDDQTDLQDMVKAQFAPDSIEYQVYMEVTSDEDYMDRVQHAMYRLMTEEINNYVAPADMVFYTKDGMYQVMLVGDSQRVRFCDYEDSKDSFQGEVTSLLPIADGTLVDAAGGDSTETTTEEPTDELLGTYYVSQYNTFSEQDLIDAYGQEYYKSLIMFQLEANGKGKIMLGNESMKVSYEFDGSILTLTTSEGMIVMPMIDGQFYCTDVNDNLYVFSKM
ncbi:MAG: hypothetical protein IJ917_00035 [Firmicutes bacterium]|nr:hypothetical protein [Bacillota bacterium]